MVASNIDQEIKSFAQQYSNSFSSNNVNTLTQFYANSIDYQYIKGHRASLQELRKEVAELPRDWPQRTYTNLTLTILRKSTTSATFELSFKYNYSNNRGKRASGWSTNTIDINKFNGSWKITKWRERVTRR